MGSLPLAFRWEDVELEELISQYRHGCSDAAAEIIRRFDRLVQRMFRFVRFGIVGRDPILRGFARIYGDGDAEQGGKEIAERLRYMGDDEIYQEIYLCLLKAALSSSNLQYGCRRNVVRRLGYLLSHRFRDSLYLEDLPVDQMGADSTLSDELWIRGISAGFPFDQLSESERELLWRVYIENERLSDLARSLNRSMSTLRQDLQAIEHKLRSLLDRVSGTDSDLLETAPPSDDPQGGDR